MEIGGEGGGGRRRKGSEGRGREQRSGVAQREKRDVIIRINIQTFHCY